VARWFSLAVSPFLAAVTSLAAAGAEVERLPVTPYGASPSAISRRGMAVAATAEAARAGADALAAGGNAVDAAVATAFALAVTYPQAGNLAGGGFAVVRTAAGEVFALDFRETAPAGTWKGTFLNADGSPRGDASRAGGLAVGTPGTVRGLEALHKRFGRLPWASLIAPAVKFARDGFRVPEGLTAELAAYRRTLTRYEETRRLFFLSGDAPLPPGTLLKQPELAATLEAIAARGADGFHRGPIAERLAAYDRSQGGVLSAEDLAGYVPVWRVPDEVDFERWRIVTMPLPSAGGFLLAAILGQLPAIQGDWRPRDTADAIHLIAEAERRAYADRNRFLGDADCADVPLARLLSPWRLAALGASIDPARATPSSAILAGGPKESDQTTHLSTATAAGDAVSLTYTLNDTFGNGAVVPGVGVLLNNEMDDFTAHPGVPNLFGLVQGEANAVRAGGRPLSSMTPSIVLEDGKPRFVLGSPGGSTISTTVLQVFLNAGPRGMPLADAVSAPRFHHQHLPDRIELDRGAFPAGLKNELRRKGHVLVDREPTQTGGKLGRVHAIAFEKDGRLLGVADPRGYGSPAGPADRVPAR
jgi:gamma-glutamyltranspeptidase / glutathione hydrolase